MSEYNNSEITYELYDEPFQILHNNFFSMTNDLSTYEKITYIALRSFMSVTEKKCFPSMKKIAEYIGASEKTVERAIKGLIEKGYIERTLRYANGKRTSNLYYIRDYRNVKKSLATTDQSKEQAKVQNIAKEQNAPMDSNNDNNKIENKSQSIVKINDTIESAKSIVENKLGKKELMSVLKACKYNLETLKKYYDASKKRNDIDNLGGWLTFNIKNNIDITNTKQQVNVKDKVNTFNAFPQRNYTKQDYNTMEQILLKRGDDKLLGKGE